MAEVAGLELDPWQKFCLATCLGEVPNITRPGQLRWASFENGIIVPRQNGKGGVLEARVLGGLFVWNEPLTLWSAHEFKTAREAFLRIDRLVTNCDELRRQVRSVNRAHGEEGITLTNGNRLLFVARTGGSGRGFTGTTIVLDEAFNLPSEVMAALLFTMAAVPNGSLWYTSSAPEVDDRNAQHLNSVRARAIAGDDPSLAWCEWSVDARRNEKGEPIPVDVHDRAGWLQSNPALGIRLTMLGTERELNAMSSDPAKFARERLGAWYVPLPDAADSRVIPAEKWAARARPGWLLADGAVALAVDVAPNSGSAAIAACAEGRVGIDTGWGHPIVEVIDHRPGTAWVVPRLLELLADHEVRVLVLDPMGPAGALVSDLEAAGILEPDAGGVLRKMTTRECAQAAGKFLADVLEGGVTHRDQPELNAAVAGAAKRPLSEAWAWARLKSENDITPLVAATGAAWGWSLPPTPEDATPAIVLL